MDPLRIRNHRIKSFDTDDPGLVLGGGFSDLAGNYYSPWDIWYNRGTGNYNFQPSYVISNGVAEVSTSPYTIRVHAWIGLAYFDGNNDGKFYDYNLSSSTPIADMTSTTLPYPNLYDGIKEVGNLVRATIATPFLPMQSARIEDIRYHLPMPTSPFPRYGSSSPFAPWASGFAPNVTLLPHETNLLRDYGKVFFYEVDVFEGGVLVDTYNLHPDIQTLPQGAAKNWYPVLSTPTTGTQLKGNLPFGSYNLYYYTNNSIPMDKTIHQTNPSMPQVCNSFELVFDARGMDTHTITGSVPKTISIGFMQDTPTFWRRSALALKVE